MRIEILRQTSIQGQVVRPGQRLEVDDRDGCYLVAARKAQQVQDPVPVCITEPRRARTRKPLPEVA